MLAILETTVTHRHLLRHFVERDLRVKYRGTVAGWLWSLLEPLSLVAIYYFVFKVIAGRGEADYPLLVLLGVLPYNLFAGVVQGGAASLVSNAALIKKVYLPRELFVLSTALSQLAVFGLSVLAVIPFVFAWGKGVGPALLLAPIAIGGLTLLAVGLGLLVACLNVLYRDVGYMLRVGLRFVFYGSPVIYPVAMVPEALRPLYVLNPLAVFLETFRAAVAGGPLLVSPAHLGGALAASALAFLAGGALFLRWEKTAVKYL